MKKCISCNQDIEDGAAFCPFCGKPQEGEAKKQFSITQRAFFTSVPSLVLWRLSGKHRVFAYVYGRVFKSFPCIDRNGSRRN